MLEHYEDFEFEKEYNQIWDKIRYEKVDELFDFTQEIIKILDNHIDDKLLFHGDYEKIQNLFKKMRWKNFFYMSGSAKQVIKCANPKFESVYEYRDCVRKLKYLGAEHKSDFFEKSKIYTSTHFNGASYKINVNGDEVTAGSGYFERLT